MEKYTPDIIRETIRNALFGQAVGDAMGVPVEFLSRATVRKINPTEMMGCDTPKSFKSWFSDIIPAGTWSDDTSMTIAAIDAIISDGGDIYWQHVMERFVEWVCQSKYTPNEFSFGLGGTCARAIGLFKNGIPSINCGGTEVNDNGNGSLMRIFPFSLYCIFKGLGVFTSVDIINTASGITHGHAISKMGCLFFTLYMNAILDGQSPIEAWETARKFPYVRWYGQECVNAYKQLLSANFPKIKDSEIKSSGYVVDTLNIAIYSMIHGHDYESSILLAINMGYDTDTSAAITGALAGVYYGFESIPDRWLAKLRGKEMLYSFADNYAQIFNA
ncbi:MAG: ADP-ribosylglycohydrolase family protein [Bacteroidales bacterium]|nr:ADP-ribosylglycohydrolase family protein [Bacteroidales bacterium]